MIRRVVLLSAVSLVCAVVCWGAPVVTARELSEMVATCGNDGVGCRVGSPGPAGGIVFYDAGSPQWWGRFLEAKRTSMPAAGPWGNGVIASDVSNKALGNGRENSKMMEALLSDSVYQRLESYFGADFWLPSKDELDVLYNYWKTSGDKRLRYAAAPMWTSSEASATFVWYQLFQDGTQFTDANGIIRGLKSNKDYVMSPMHVGSNFLPTAFQVIGVRAFGSQNSTVGRQTLVSATSNNQQCSGGGATALCNVGDIGPGGGIVFYDAGSKQSWGRYLEIAPQSCEGVRLPWRPAGNVASIYKGKSAAVFRVSAKGLGMGRQNTLQVIRSVPVSLDGSYAAKFADDSVCGGKDDWFLPSKDELDIAFNRLAQNRVAGNDTPVGGFSKGYYWTSTDYNNATAWTQYFMDGQQFDRVQTLDGNRTPPTPFRVRPVRAFG